MIVSFGFGMTTRAFFQKFLSVGRASGSVSITRRIWLSFKARTNRYSPWRMIFQYASLPCRSALQAEMIRRTPLDRTVYIIVISMPFATPTQ